MKKLHSKLQNKTKTKDNNHKTKGKECRFSSLERSGVVFKGKRTLTKQVYTGMNLSMSINRIIVLLTGIIFLLAATGCSRQMPEKPILILATQKNFGTYTGEILKAEGFNEYIIDSLNSGNIDNSYLSQFDLVILAEPVAELNSLGIIRNYVNNGGNLIAFQPSQSSFDLFGIERVQGDLKCRYLSIDTSAMEGKSLYSGRILIHAIAEKYEIKDARVVAWFCDNQLAEHKFPAVVANSFGRGHTVAFLYGLPQNIVYTRQGNPEFPGIEKDGIPGLRAMDLFTDGWVDPSENTKNQSDVQMALLSHCIEFMMNNNKPLPRLWYFPDTLKCLVTLTNDGEFRGENDFETQFRDIDSMGCGMSLYVMETGKVTKQWAERWSSKGFEISGHPDNTKEAGSPVWHDVENELTCKMKEISDLYGIPMRTVVNHWFVWCGKDNLGRAEFAAQAEIEANHGLEMDINYAHYDNNSSQDHFLGPLGINQGNFTGSGLPMRFATSNGKILNIFQHLNNVYDQQYNENHDAEGFFSCFRGLMDRSIRDEVYSFISVKSHNDEYYFSKAPLRRMLAYADSNGIPVWTAAHLLEFIKVRDEAGFSGINRTGNDLEFNLNSSITGKNGLTFMVPFRHGCEVARKVTIDGKVVSLIIRRVRGNDYVLGTVVSGKNYHIDISYGK